MSVQTQLFQWAASQPAITGALILGFGLAEAFQGWRLSRAFSLLTCAIVGWIVGQLAGQVADLSGPVLPGVAAAVLTWLALLRKRFGLAVASAATWSVFGAYLAQQLRLPGLAQAIAGLLGIGGGIIFSVLSPRSMAVILTALQGTALMVVGWVCVSSRMLPPVGETFRAWAAAQGLVVPVLLGMLFVTGYCYQVAHQQGDIRSGV
jgi:hypothetical protein